MLQRTRSNLDDIRILPRGSSSLRRWSGTTLFRYLGKKKDENERSSRTYSQQHDEQRETERGEEMKRRRARLQDLLQRAHAEYQSRQRPQ